MECKTTKYSYIEIDSKVFVNSKIISNEENLLIKVLFSNAILGNIDFSSIDLTKFIAITSKHLMLPALYFNLKLKNLNGFLPKDLNDYLLYVYRLNANRNKEILKLSEFLSINLNANNINYCLIKGTALIQCNENLNIGERMIGDIDILIDRNNYKKVKEILNKLGYYNSHEYKIWKTRHSPRFKNSSSICAIEIHYSITDRDEKLNLSSKELLKKRIKIKNTYILPNPIQRDICIYNHMINDYGLFKCFYNYRSLYDFDKILKNCPPETRTKSKIHLNFYSIITFLGINNLAENYKGGFFIFRLKMKKKIKLIFFIDNQFAKFIIYFKNKINQILEFMINSNYRKNILGKLIDRW